MSLGLTERDAALLAGEGTPAEQLSMRIVTQVAAAMRAERLLDVTGAHVDGCLYHGQAGMDFAGRLAGGEGWVSVPTTLNVSSLDLLHPDLYRGAAGTARSARALMELYEDMGCRPTWTCAPYQLPERPGFGEHVAWAESNAIVFANSVLGARTHRYGDFIDICAAITGRAPAAGLHLDAERRGTIVFDLAGLPEHLLERDVLFPVLGHMIGDEAGAEVPVIVGLAEASEDQLKALGAAAASSGAVALFHVVGVTPEADTLEAACGGLEPASIITVTPERLRAARDDLSTVGDGEIFGVNLGTPHASIRELTLIGELIGGDRVADGVDFYVSTSRSVLGEARQGDLADRLEAAGVLLVVDTCTYITPILKSRSGAVMTDSAKWAYYAPGNLGVGVVFGTTEECVRSAITGQVERIGEVWAGV